jgi:CHASE2 domain-containing sensor protein
MEASELAAKFDNRVVLVGDFRNTDDRRTYFDGRELSVCYAHAAGIEMLIKSLMITRPSRAQTTPIVLAAAGLGLLPVYFARGGHTRRIVLLTCLGMLLATLCLAVFCYSLYLCTPFVPIAAMLVSCELAAWYNRVFALQRRQQE